MLRVDGRDLILHNQGLNSNKRPLGFILLPVLLAMDRSRRCSWVSVSLRLQTPMANAENASMCIYHCMWMEMVHELAVNARNGGKVGYYAYMEVWLNKLVTTIVLWFRRTSSRTVHGAFILYGS